MKTLRTFVIVPALPKRLAPLLTIARNLWWSWHPGAVELFERVDPEVWQATHHNPVQLLGRVSRRQLEALAEDDSFTSHMETVAQRLDEYLHAPSWFTKHHSGEEGLIAYFSAEYGFHECLPIYSGGLGILSGEHLKSASDLGLPMVGVGLAYRHGYFRQYLSSDGWQQETYPENTFHSLPVEHVRAEDGSPLKVDVPVGKGSVAVRVWRVQIGRVPLFLLDSNVESNPPEMRAITSQLYGGDARMRILQEILLGIGGIRVLRTLGIDPAVCHMNEGHSAFLGLARCHCLMRSFKMDFAAAREAATAGAVFTTHTPVAAGNDRFPPALFLEYLGDYCREMGLSPEEALALGREDPTDDDELFCMTILALKLSSHANGVSRLHGEVSRAMWQGLWPELPAEETPIHAITNGIHIPSWVSEEMERLYRRYLGPQWREQVSKPSLWERTDRISGAELWTGHSRMRERLVSFARNRLRAQLLKRGLPQAEVARANEVLDPEALTLGFARRFATYKRATLLFHDLDRLAAIVGNRDRPVQIVFASKAHPHDTAGKELIRDIVHVAQEKRFRNRIVFIEDYDIDVARHLVQGVDVWLNTPRRPLEASGTSGMKVVPNGGLHLSVLDGWWCEAHRPDNGWTIGSGETYDDPTYGDEVEAQALLALLEQELVPLFYDRGADDLPRGWIARMRGSIKSICPTFNTDRMVREYCDQYYLPAARLFMGLAEEDFRGARQLAEWLDRMRHRWGEVAITHMEHGAGELQVGSDLAVAAQVRLGPFTPEELRVEIYHGALDSDRNLVGGSSTAMALVHTNGDGTATYEGAIPCHDCGPHGYTVRVLPHHPHLANPYHSRLVVWG